MVALLLAYVRGLSIIIIVFGFIFTIMDLYNDVRLSYILGNDIEIFGVGMIGLELCHFLKKRILRAKIIREVEGLLSQPDGVVDFDDHTRKLMGYQREMVRANKFNLAQLEQINRITEKHKQRAYESWKNSLRKMHSARGKHLYVERNRRHGY
jgi:hypothetical protein